MERRETSGEIDEAAAAWTARIDRAPLSAEDQLAFDAWLAGDRRRLGAFAKAQAIMAHADDMRAAQVFGDRRQASGPQRSRRALFYGAAAAAAVAVTVGAEVLNSRTVLNAAKGEVRLAPLPDGSSVTLNTASKVRIRFSRQIRRVDLIEGEALFDVAKDARRPFVVYAGGSQVRAVGTAFTVRRLPSGQVRVVVREGVVEIEDGAAGAPIRLAANSIAVSGPPAVAASSEAPSPPAVIRVVAVTPSDVSRELAWREGLLAFNGETLRDAVAEFSRYSDTQLVVDDPALGSETIAGLFSANNPVGFARTAAASLGGHIEVQGNEVRIVR